MALAPVTRARVQAALAAGGTALLWWRAGGPWPAALALVASLLALLAWLSPAHYAPVQRALDAILRVLLTGFTWLTLGAVYFGLFTPLRFFGALLRRDPLRLRPLPPAESYFQPLPPATARRFDRQF